MNQIKSILKEQNERRRMLKLQDDKKGVIRVYWQDVRTRVAKIDAVLASIIDEINPDKNFPLYLAYYPYGETIADQFSFYLPGDNGGENFKLSDSNVSKELISDLGYAKNSLAMGMLLENTIEYSIDIKGEEAAMPWIVYSPGAFFPFSYVLTRKSQHLYPTNRVLVLTAGVRSVLMLPNISSTAKHAGLQKDFNIQSAAPKTLYEHWHVFKEIINNPVSECNWRSCVLYFSASWLEKLQHDGAWMKFKSHLHELAWKLYEYQRNKTFYDIYFSVIQKRRRLKPNPYLVDIAKHLFATAIGAVPGYMPAHNEEGLPLKLLQKAYIESYGLDRYFPTIMQATHFDFDKDIYPIYYSLKHPSTHIFSPKARKAFSAIVELRELEHIMKISMQEWQKDSEMCSDTIVNKVAKRLECQYFHNEVDRLHIVKTSSDIPTLDDRFDKMPAEYKTNDRIFASDAPFVRGCVSLKSKAISS